MIDRDTDPVRQVAAIGVMAYLVALAEDVQWVLAFEHLQDEVRNDVRKCKLDIPAHDVGITNRPALADAHAIERSHDRVWELILLPGAFRKELRRELLETVR